MAGLALSGLASGVDTSSIVDQLMAIERQSLSRISLGKLRVQARQTGLNDVQTKLSALKTATAELRATSLWSNKQTVTSSDAARIGAERLSETAPENFSFTVEAMAKGTHKTFGYTPSSLASSLTVDGVAVNVAADGTVDDVVSAINAKTDIAVYAAKVSGQLVLTSKSTGAGAASDFAVSGTQVAEDVAKAVAGADARYTVDGQDRTWPSNVIEDAIPGVRLTLKALTSGPVSVTVSPPSIDKDAVKAKLKGFVDAYNAVVQTARDKLTEKADPKSVTTAGQTKGQLFGDPGLSSMLSALRIAISDTVTGNGAASDQLADLGISTGKTTGAAATADSLAGKLTLDETKLADAMATDPNAVKRLLGGVTGVEGFAQRIEGYVTQQAGSGSLLAGRVKSSDDEIRRIDTRYADTERRIAGKETRLRAQFAAMESALQASQTQSSWLTAQLTALNR